MKIETNPTIKAQLLAWADKHLAWYDKKNPDMGYIWRQVLLHYNPVGIDYSTHPDPELLGKHKEDFLSASEHEEKEEKPHTMEEIVAPFFVPPHSPPVMPPVTEMHKEEHEEKEHSEDEHHEEH